MERYELQLSAADRPGGGLDFKRRGRDIVVSGVAPDSPGALARIPHGLVVARINGVAIASVDALKTAFKSVGKVPPGRTKAVVIEGTRRSAASARSMGDMSVLGGLGGKRGSDARASPRSLSAYVPPQPATARSPEELRAVSGGLRRAGTTVMAGGGVPAQQHRAPPPRGSAGGAEQSPGRPAPLDVTINMGDASMLVGASTREAAEPGAVADSRRTPGSPRGRLKRSVSVHDTSGGGLPNDAEFGTAALSMSVPAAPVDASRHGRGAGHRRQPTFDEPDPAHAAESRRSSMRASSRANSVQPHDDAKSAVTVSVGGGGSRSPSLAGGGGARRGSELPRSIAADRRERLHPAQSASHPQHTGQHAHAAEAHAFAFGGGHPGSATGGEHAAGAMSGIDRDRLSSIHTGEASSGEFEGTDGGPSRTYRPAGAHVSSRTRRSDPPPVDPYAHQHTMVSLGGAVGMAADDPGRPRLRYQCDVDAVHSLETGFWTPGLRAEDLSDAFAGVKPVLARRGGAIIYFIATTADGIVAVGTRAVYRWEHAPREAAKHATNLVRCVLLSDISEMVCTTSGVCALVVPGEFDELLVLPASGQQAWELTMGTVYKQVTRHALPIRRVGHLSPDELRSKLWLTPPPTWHNRPVPFTYKYDISIPVTTQPTLFHPDSPPPAHGQGGAAYAAAGPHAAHDDAVGGGGGGSGGNGGRSSVTPPRQSDPMKSMRDAVAMLRSRVAAKNARKSVVGGSPMMPRKSIAPGGAGGPMPPRHHRQSVAPGMLPPSGAGGGGWDSIPMHTPPPQGAHAHGHALGPPGGPPGMGPEERDLIRQEVDLVSQQLRSMMDELKHLQRPVPSDASPSPMATQTLG